MTPNKEEVYLKLAESSYEHPKLARLVSLLSVYHLLEGLVEIVYLQGPQGPTDGGSWPDEQTAEARIRERYPEAVFTEWEENNEPEAVDEFVKYAIVGNDLVAAIYEEA